MPARLISTSLYLLEKQVRKFPFLFLPSKNSTPYFYSLPLYRLSPKSQAFPSISNASRPCWQSGDAYQGHWIIGYGVCPLARLYVIVDDFDCRKCRRISACHYIVGRRPGARPGTPVASALPSGRSAEGAAIRTQPQRI